MTAPGRAREVGTNASLLLSTAAAHLGEDPLLLTVQAGRRLPRPVTRAVARAVLVGCPPRGARGALRRAVAAWLLDHPVAAHEELALARPTGRAGRRLADELAVQLGGAPLSPDPSGAVVARAAWSRGAVTEAVDAAGSSLLGARYRDREALLRGERRPAARTVRTPVRSARGVAPGAFHVLVNSVPHTQSGYAARSHAVLRAQAAAGIRVAAATRLGYPVSVGVPAARHLDVVDGVPYHRLLPPSLPRLESDRLDRQVSMLEPLVRAHAPTVLHTTTHHPQAWVTQALARSTGLPWVYEVRGLLEDSWAARRAALGDDDAPASEYYRLFRAAETEAALTADHVVTLSRTLAAELGSRGVPSERITVVPNGVDEALLSRPDPGPAAAREALGLSRSGFWVGTVSSLVDYEGLDTVLDAVCILRDRGVDVRACLVGDGVARPSLEKRAAALGLGDAAVFPGRVTSDQAPAWHQALDLFTVPRRDSRVTRLVTPLKPVEAMALGRPVLMSDLPALTELVDGRQDGVPAGDAPSWADEIEALAGDRARRSSLVAAGRELAAGRTWRTAGTTYRRLYEHLAGAA